MAKEKEKSISDIIDELNSTYGSTGHQVAKLGNQLVDPGYIRTGNILVDSILLGGKGLPKGNIAMLVGWEGTGKSWFLKNWLAAAQQQEQEKYVVIIPAEQGDYTPDGLEAAGIDPNRIIVLNGSCAEESFQMLLGLLWDKDKKKPRDIISMWGVDSLAALVPSEELEINLDEDTARAPMARLLHRFLRPVVPFQGDAIGVMVNQLRQGMGATPAQQQAKPFGGKAPAYWPKVIFKFQPFNEEKEGKAWQDQQTTSFQISVKSEKNNTHVGVKGSQVYYSVYTQIDEDHDRGVDFTECLVRSAIMLGLIKKAGAGWCTLQLPDGSILKSQGEVNVAKDLKKNNMIDVVTQQVLDAAWKKASITRCIEQEETIEEEI